MDIEDVLHRKLVRKDEEKNIFTHISDQDLNAIIELYYSKEKNVQEIVEDYRLPLQNISSFSKHLPDYYMDKKCPYDGSYLTAPLPSKGNLSTYSPDGTCLECNHVEYSGGNYLKQSCSCLNCKKEEVLEKETVVKVIRDVYKDPVELNELSIMDRLHIAALLQLLGIEYGYLIPPYRTYSDVNDSFSDNVLNDLLDRDILKVAEQNSLNVFSNITETSFSYARQEVYLLLNISHEVYDDEEIFELLKTGSGIEIEDGEELVSIWKDLVKNELYKLFKFQMKELKFTRELGNVEKEKKILNAFDRWLELYSPSQIYAILYKVIRDADNQRTSNKWGNYTYHEIDFIVKLADQMIVRYEKEEWGIKSYNYPYQLEFDIQTKLFFSKVAKEKNWFNKLVPAPEKIINEEIEANMTIVKNYSNYANEIEMQTMDAFLTSTLDHAVYYSLSPIGLIIHDGNIDCLFATRKSLVEYVLFLEKNGKIDSAHKATTIEEIITYNSGLYVDNSYSSKLIYLIMTRLIEKQVPFLEEPERY